MQSGFSVPDMDVSRSVVLGRSQGSVPGSLEKFGDVLRCGISDKCNITQRHAGGILTAESGYSTPVVADVTSSVTLDPNAPPTFPPTSLKNQQQPVEAGGCPGVSFHFSPPSTKSTTAADAWSRSSRSTVA